MRTDTTMSVDDAFERALSIAFAELADLAPVEVDPAGITESSMVAAASGQAMGRPPAVRWSRAGLLVAATLVLLTVAIGIAVVGSRPKPLTTEIIDTGFAKVYADLSVVRRDHTATLLEDGRILLSGGYEVETPDDGAIASAEILDPQTGTSEPVGDLTRARSGHASVRLTDGRVLVVAGEPATCPNDGGCERPPVSAEVFDPETLGFTGLALDFGDVRAGFDSGPTSLVALPAGRAIAAFDTGHATDQLVAVYLIDPSSGAATRMPLAPCHEVVSLVALANGRVLAQCGGDLSDGSWAIDPADSSVVPFAETGSWDRAVGLDDGRILLTDVTGEAALLDPGTGATVPVGRTIGRPPEGGIPGFRPWKLRLTTALPGGRALISGGRAEWPDGGDDADQAELFEASTGSFRPVGPMVALRHGHTATVLDDGRVLLIGGVVPSAYRTDPESIPVEVFHPSDPG